MSDKKLYALSASEVTLLRRALVMYANSYDAMRAQSRVEWEKEESKRYAAAAGALSERLLREGRPVEEKEQP